MKVIFFGANKIKFKGTSRKCSSHFKRKSTIFINLIFIILKYFLLSLNMLDIIKCKSSFLAFHIYYLFYSGILINNIVL